MTIIGKEDDVRDDMTNNSMIAKKNERILFLVVNILMLWLADRRRLHEAKTFDVAKSALMFGT